MKRLLFCIFLIATGMFSGAVVHAANNCTGATYYDADSDTCIACPTGYDYNVDAGKTSITQCQVHCAAGTYNNGYSRLEYIEGTGTQYIDTNISAPSGFIADANVTFTDLTKANTIVGEENANGDSYRNFIKVQKNGNKVNWLLGKGAFTWSTATVATNTKYHVVGSTLTTGAYIDVNETAVVLPATGGNRTSRNILLFTTSWEISGNGNNISHMKMYDIKIWDANNVLVRDFIPVRRHSDGAIGMYDRVSDTFFGNAGTGTFIAGEDVNNVFGDGTCTNVGPYHWAGESTVNYGSVGTRNACPAGTHSATQTGTSADVCVACASNEFEYYDGETATCMETKFTVNTTQMNAGDTFSFYMSAVGDFYIDWGDGKSELIKKTSAANTLYSHTYTNASGANGWSIKFGGASATGSPSYSSSAVAPLKFYGGTPTLVATVDGSLGALFPTRGNTATTQPRFVETFRGCTNLTQISSDLFNGVTGAFDYMFYNTFYGCTSLTTIPVGLFSGVSGTASRLFYGTFQNCSSVTGIPNGLFANITGAPAAYMFESTFNGCTNLTGAVPAGMFSGISGAPAQEMFRQTFQNTKITSVGNNFLGQITSGGSAVQMFYQTFYNCKQLTTVPVDMFNFNDVTTGTSMFAGTFSGDTALTTLPVIAGFDGIPAQDMFNGTFQNCSSLTGSIPNNMFSGISGAPALRMFSSTFNGCTNLTGAVPAGIFSNITGAPAQQMFANTFNGTKITSVGNNFLGQITSGGSAVQMFSQTFYNCKQLTSVPIDMFNFNNVATGLGMFSATFSGDTALTTLPVISGFDGMPAQAIFQDTFKNCASLTGPIPNNMFSGISGAPATYMFSGTFYGCTNLTGAVPAGIFSNITGAPAQQMFANTFNGTKITSVGNNFLGQITSGGSAVQMFSQTFYNCKQLTSVPIDMFNFNNVATGLGMFSATFSGDTALTTLPVISGFDGMPAQSMFQETFKNCASLTGSIPNNMFSGISGAPATYMFYSTFNGCSNLTGYVPSTLFSGISIGTTANAQMTTMFMGTNLYTSCPCGTRTYTTGFESYFNIRGSGANTVYATACEVGTKSNEHWHNGICTTNCALGFTELKTSNGLNYPVLSDKVSTPAINIGTGNNVCYVPLASGNVTNAINMSDGVNSYHAVVPDETAPVGFTG